MGIQVLGNNVLVAETEKEEQSAGGIILTEAIDKGNKPGLVLAVGDEVLNIQSGQRVFLKWSESMPVNVDGKAAVIISQEHIKAIIS